jgi:hypothetical protein
MLGVGAVAPHESSNRRVLQSIDLPALEAAVPLHGPQRPCKRTAATALGIYIGQRRCSAICTTPMITSLR